MENIVSVVKKHGPYAPGDGLDLVKLALGGMEVFVQPDCGMDITEILGAKRSFLSRSTGVTSSENVRSLSSPLYDALSVLPAWPSTTLPGYDSLTGLHRGLSGVKPIDNVFSARTYMEERVTVQEVFARYDLSGSAITGNVFSQAAIATRIVRLIQAENGTITLERETAIQATRTCYVNLLEHPNPEILPGDRVLTNLDLVSKVDGELCIFDRDGVTPAGLNIFQSVAQSALLEPRPERCFFMHHAGTDSVPMLLISSSQESGLGFTHKPIGDTGCFTLVWLSPMGPNEDRGFGSIESSTTLPLGASRNNKLGMVVRLSAGETVNDVTSITFLDTPDLVKAFVDQHQIDMNAEHYPKTVVPDGNPQNYDPETATFDKLRRAAKIID